MKPIIWWVVSVALGIGLPVSAAGSAAEGALDEAVEPARISMEFQDANLKDVLKVFSQQTGVNVIASEEIGDQAITLYLEDVTAIDAFAQLLRAGNLTYERPAGSEIYIVRPKGVELAATVTRVYRLKFARVSQSVLAKAASAFGARTPFEAAAGVGSQGTSGSTTGGSGGSAVGQLLGSVGLGGGGGGSQTGGTAGQVEVGIDLVIKPLLTPKGSVVVDGRTNSMIVTDLPENFPRIEAALAALDVQTYQILVEAEVLETSLSNVKDLGLEWGTGSEGELGTLTPGSRSTRFPFGWIGHGDAPTASTAFSLTTLSLSSAKGILQALEKDTDTKILARPKILTLDNESAIIRLTTSQAVGFESTSQTQTGTVTSKPERTTTGVVLSVTPQVNERGYITMLVEPSVTKVVTSQISPPSGQSTPIDPKTRSARSLVRIKSGDTLVLGGLIDRSDEQTVQRVPILSSIPVIGKAFQNTERTKSASELLVFVTPRLLEDATQARVASTVAPLPGLKAQEPMGERQQVIEQTLSSWEQHPL